MRQKLKMSSQPTNVRILLIILSVLVLAITVVIIFFANKYLTNYADEVASTTAQSKDTQATLDNLARAKSELKEQQGAVEKAKRIVAESKEYQYQNQIINDLSAYARDSSIVISSFMFDNASDQTAPEAGGIAGLKTAHVTINLSGSIRYSDFLNFLALIENNATRMQIQGVSMAPVLADMTDNDPAQAEPATDDLVSVRSLTIGVYIR